MKPLAFDTETALIAPGLLAPPLTCISYSDAPMLAHVAEGPDRFASLLSDPSVLLVGHNTPYDMAVIGSEWPELLPAIFEAYSQDRVTCTIVREKLQMHAIGTGRSYQSAIDGGKVKTSYTLAAIAKRRLGIVLDKDTWRLRYGELRNVPLDLWDPGARQYAADDATTTLAVYQDQARNPDLLADEFRQARAAWWLHLMSCWGLTTDPVAVARLEAQIRADIETIRAQLLLAGLLRSDGTRDTKATKARVVEAYEKLGEPHPTTPTGQPSADADCCEHSGDLLLIAYSQYTGLQAKLTKDIPLYHKGLIQTRFDSLLVTGRTSSSPNVQNINKEPGHRECFVPKLPGWVYVDADYSGFELCSLAQACLDLLGNSRLAEVLNEGNDPHLALASEIVGCDYNTAKTNRASKAIDDARQAAKIANFGFPGGLGPTRFVEFARRLYGVVFDEAKARDLKAYWLRAWPEMHDYFKLINRQIDIGLPVQQLRSGRYRADATYCETCNTYFQGLAADAAKHAGFLIAKACYVDAASPLFGCRPCNFIHDEFIIEAPEPIAHLAAAELASLMVDGAQCFIPNVTIRAEPLIMRVWSKKAKPTYNAEGILIPWQPTN